MIGRDRILNPGLTDPPCCHGPLFSTWEGDPDGEKPSLCIGLPSGICILTRRRE